MEKADNQVVKTKRDLLLEKLRTKYPEDNFDEEDALYGKIYDDYDNYDNKMSEYKKNEEGLSKMFSSDPRSAAFLMAWKAGENPVVQLVKMFGPDFMDAMNDPENMEKVAEARSEYLEKQANNEKLQAEAEKNLADSLDELDKLQEEKGLSDEQVQQAFEFIAGIIDNGIVNRIERSTWEMAFKALSFDQAVEDAALEAEIKGRNAKIEEKLKKTNPDLPPMIAGNSGKPSPTPNFGALDRVSNADDIWNKGSERRIKRK